MKQQRILVVPKNTDTDQIITAEFMKFDPSTPEGRANLGARAFCGLPDGFGEVINPESGTSHFQVVLGGANFGCGSSREHAPVAMGVAGLKVVLAPSFARIFFRNCIASGEVLPLVAPKLDIAKYTTGEVIELDFDRRQATVEGVKEVISFQPIGDLEQIVQAGGLFPFARSVGRLASA